MFASHTGALLMKPNVYADFSVMDQIYTASTLAGILRGWLSQYPEKVLFGTDAFANGPDSGWELSAWLASTTARQALGMALTGMVRDGEITRARAVEIARMVLRGNAAKLYALGPYYGWTVWLARSETTGQRCILLDRGDRTYARCSSEERFLSGLLDVAVPYGDVAPEYLPARMTRGQTLVFRWTPERGMSILLGEGGITYFGDPG
jgi:hypothetical protein